MNLGNVLKANLSGHINELDVVSERKGEIKDVILLWVEPLGSCFSYLLRWERPRERKGSNVSQKEGSK